MYSVQLSLTESNIVMQCNKDWMGSFRLIQGNTESHGIEQGHEKKKKIDKKLPQQRYMAEWNRKISL